MIPSNHYLQEHHDSSLFFGFYSLTVQCTQFFVEWTLLFSRWFKIVGRSIVSFFALLSQLKCFRFPNDDILIQYAVDTINKFILYCFWHSLLLVKRMPRKIQMRRILAIHGDNQQRISINMYAACLTCNIVMIDFLLLVVYSMACKQVYIFLIKQREIQYSLSQSH